MANLRAFAENTGYSLHLLNFFSEKVHSRLAVILNEDKGEMCGDERAKLMAFIELAVEVCEDFTRTQAIEHPNRIILRWILATPQMSNLTISIAIIDLLARGKLKSIQNRSGTFNTRGVAFESLLEGYTEEKAFEVHHDLSYIRQAFVESENIIWSLVCHFRMECKLDLLLELLNYTQEHEGDRNIVLLAIIDSYIETNADMLDGQIGTFDHDDIYHDVEPITNAEAFRIVLSILGTFVIEKQFLFLKSLVKWLKTPASDYFLMILSYIETLLKHEKRSITFQEIVDLYHESVSLCPSVHYTNECSPLLNGGVSFTMLAACIDKDGDKVMRNSHFKQMLKYFEPERAKSTLSAIFKHYGSTKDISYMHLAINLTSTKSTTYNYVINTAIKSEASARDFSEVVQYGLELANLAEYIEEDIRDNTKPKRIIDNMNASLDFLKDVSNIINNNYSSLSKHIRHYADFSFLLQLMDNVKSAGNSKTSHHLAPSTAMEYLICCYIAILPHNEYSRYGCDILVWRSLIRMVNQPDCSLISLDPPSFLASNWPWEASQHVNACSVEQLLKQLPSGFSWNYLTDDYGIKCQIPALQNERELDFYRLRLIVTGGGLSPFLNTQINAYQILVNELVNAGMWMSALRCCIMEEIHNKVRGILLLTLF